MGLDDNRYGERPPELLLWRDGEFLTQTEAPFDVYGGTDYDHHAGLAVGGCGWAVVDVFAAGEEPLRAGFVAYDLENGTWNRIEGSGEGPGALMLCAADRKPLFAAADEAGAIALYDPATGALQDRFETGIPAAQLAHMAFAREDSVLLLFESVGKLHVFSLDGTRLTTLYLRDRNLRFADSGTYRLAERPDGRLLVGYLGLYAGQAVTIELSPETWEMTGFLIGVQAYIPSRDEYLLYDYGSPGLYTNHRCTTEELTALGRDLVGTEATAP